jgi:bisphosphoglycerate-dependent phosphoglycerate mutase
VRRRVLFVRHGVTNWNREGRFQGHQDPPLSADGLNEARLVASRLAESPEERPARIVTSPLLRSRQTADAIAAALDGDDLVVESDRRLMELGQGEWEGRTHAELEVNDAERYAAWRRSSPRRPPPGGESLEAATTGSGPCSTSSWEATIEEPGRSAWWRTAGAYGSRRGACWRSACRPPGTSSSITPRYRSSTGIVTGGGWSPGTT